VTTVDKPSRLEKSIPIDFVDEKPYKKSNGIAAVLIAHVTLLCQRFHYSTGNPIRVGYNSRKYTDK
ncbi:unnamed protein product, partial [Allacma fusca]